MVWGLLLSAVTIGASALLESSSGNAVAGNSRPNSQASSSALHFQFGLRTLSESQRIFLAGAVLGVGVSLLWSTLNNYFRIIPSLRVFCRFMTNTDESKELFPFRIPSSVKDCANGQTSGDCLDEEHEEQQHTIDKKESIGRKQRHGFVRTLVNPSMAATAHLHVQYVTLPPHYEMPPRKANVVELYYVISGSGVMSQQGIPERQTLDTGDCCVVDAGHMRWMKNTGTTHDLVLLRATDGSPSLDWIRKDPNHRSTYIGLDASATLIANGLRVLQSKASDFYNSRSSSNNINSNTKEASNLHSMAKDTGKGSQHGPQKRSEEVMSQ